MKKLIAVIVLLFAMTGCEVAINDSEPLNGAAKVTSTEYPTVNLPYRLRQRNWTGDNDEGSCVHATMVSLLRWQGRYQMAEHWRQTYGNGDVANADWAAELGRDDSLAEKCEREGLRLAYTVDGNVEFLEWACRTRRGCGVTVFGGKHVLTLVHFDNEVAGILDNNSTKDITWVSRETFVSEWQNSNGWAFTPVYTPAPPLIQ